MSRNFRRFGLTSPKEKKQPRLQNKTLLPWAKEFYGRPKSHHLRLTTK